MPWRCCATSYAESAPLCPVLHIPLPLCCTPLSQRTCSCRKMKVEQAWQALGEAEANNAEATELHMYSKLALQYVTMELELQDWSLPSWPCNSSRPQGPLNAYAALTAC
jgi:hypothetical protein